MTTLLDVFDRPIAFQRPLVDVVGSVNGALILSQAIYWQKRCKAGDGWWWKTDKEWQEETGMSLKSVRSAIQKCSNVLRKELRGCPAKNHYRVDEEAIIQAIGWHKQFDQNGQASLPEMIKPDSLKGKSSYSTETTSESTLVANSGDIPPKDESGPTGRSRSAAGDVAFEYKERYAKALGLRFRLLPADYKASKLLLSELGSVDACTEFFEKLLASDGWNCRASRGSLMKVYSNLNHIREELAGKADSKRPGLLPSQALKLKQDRVKHIKCILETCNHTEERKALIDEKNRLQGEIQEIALCASATRV